MSRLIVRPDTTGIPVIPKAGAVAATRALSGLLYSVQALDTLTFVIVLGGVASTAVIANLVPAARVVARAPLAALKGD